MGTKAGTIPARLGLLVLAAAAGCGESTTQGSCSSTSDCDPGFHCVDGRCAAVASDGDADVDGDTDSDGDADGDGDGDSTGCPPPRVCDNRCCPSGEICAGGNCCAPADLCGAVCCAAGWECTAERCVLDCAAEETPCGIGEDAACCGAAQLCYLAECVTPGSPCESVLDCDEGEYCEATAGRCLPRAQGTEECEWRPSTTEELQLVEEWSWSSDAEVLPTYDQVMMAPMVANLTDDNGDGQINERDIPDIVFHTYAGGAYSSDGVLRAISGADGSRVWPTSDPGYRTTPGGEVAIADVDHASPGPEVLACSEPRASGHLIMVSAGGELLRRYDTPPNDVPCGLDAPAVADMDGDGVPEIVVRWVIAHGDGTVVNRIRDDRAAVGHYNTLADVAGDEDLELVSPSGVYELDGTALWERLESELLGGKGYVAVGDLDLDGAPEIVVVMHADHSIRALDPLTGNEVWGPFDVNPPEMAAEVAANGNPAGGGPPTIANFDDDPEPEIAFAGGFAYVIFEHNGSRSWWFETTDRSSRSTGSSIFDFEGDGQAEVLYNDEQVFRVFHGPSGQILHDQCNTSATITEYPIVVDVDNDDNAEIVLMENNHNRTCDDGSTSRSGIHVFGHPEAEWVRTRRIWNQHTYHVTNIEEDGTVPRREQHNWTTEGLNNFRQNVQPEGLFDAPDLIPADLYISTSACPATLAISVRVINQGLAGVPAGVPVTFYQTSPGERMAIGRGETTRPLLPGESELVEMTPAFQIPAGLEDSVFELEAVINDADDAPVLWLHECREENNTAGPLEAACSIIQ